MQVHGTAGWQGVCPFFFGFLLDVSCRPGLPSAAGASLPVAMPGTNCQKAIQSAWLQIVGRLVWACFWGSSFCSLEECLKNAQLLLVNSPEGESCCRKSEWEMVRRWSNFTPGCELLLCEATATCLQRIWFFHWWLFDCSAYTQLYVIKQVKWEFYSMTMFSILKHGQHGRRILANCPSSFAKRRPAQPYFSCCCQVIVWSTKEEFLAFSNPWNPMFLVITLPSKLLC